MEFFEPVQMREGILITGSGTPLELTESLEMSESLELTVSTFTNIPEPETGVSQYNPAATYAEGDLVWSQVKVFRSLVDGNIGRDPYLTYGSWEELEPSEVIANLWTSTTTFGIDTKCYVAAGTHKVYQSIVNNNLNVHPKALVTGRWVEVCSTNLYKMFDNSSGSHTRFAGNMDIWFNLVNYPDVDTLAVLDILGAESVRVTVYAADQETILWQQSQDLMEWDMSLPVDWYWWLFSDAVPKDSIVFTQIDTFSQPTKLRVEITKADSAVFVEVGTLAFGTARVVGETQWNAVVGIMDFSKKERDDFGNFAVIERRYANTLECDCFLPNSAISAVKRDLAAVRAKPVVWIGSTIGMFSPTIIYGFYKNFRIVLDGPGGSYCSLEIEGLA